LKRILIVTKHFKDIESGGGAQKSIELLVNELRLRFHIEVLCKNTQNSNEWVHKLSFSFLKKIKSFDIIYLNSFFSPLTILFLFFNKVKIISPKGEFFEGALKSKTLKKQIWLKIFNILFKDKFVFHATSLEEKKSIEKKTYPKKIIIAPDIIELNIAKQKPSENKILKVVHVSRIDQKKNLLFCINILSKVKRQICFDIYGDIGDKKYFDKCMLGLRKLPSNINWNYLGKLKPSQVNNTFLKYDLFFFPTLGENFGYVILESLSNYCSPLLSKGTTIFDDLDKYSLGSNLKLDKKPLKWVNYIENFNSTKEEKDLLKFKNYLYNKFNISKIIKSNNNLINEVLKQ
jgi:glycosyltransferase involved in cell wall biosynthesis